MERINEVRLDHIVEFSEDPRILVATREHGTGYLRIYIVNETTGDVLTRRGRTESWQQLSGSTRENIINCLLSARSTDIPVLKVAGNYQINLQ